MYQISSYPSRKLLGLVVFVLAMHASAQRPTISSFSPTKGAIGTSVTITGSNFSAVAANNIVYFGDVKAVITSATTTTLTVVVPPGASYQPVSVTTSGLTTSSMLPFTILFSSDGTPYSTSSFSPKADSSWGGAISIGATDLDGDGDVDPVIVNNGSNFISIVTNNSSIGAIALSNSASSRYTTGTSPVYASFGDLDGDGKKDIVVANNKDNTLSVFKNNSTTDSILLLPKIDIATGNSPFIVSIRDLDNDGKPDIVCTNNAANTISVFRNTSTGNSLSFASKIDYATGGSPYGLLVSDIDGDGVVEIIVANENDLTISVFKNNSTPGNISLGNKIDIQSGYVSWLSAADFDGDGKTDIAATTSQSSFCVLRNTSTAGNYSFATAQLFNAGFGKPTTLAIADIDGDGKPDFALNHTFYSTVSILKNLSVPGSLSFSSNTDLYAGQMPSSLLLADLDNDGRPDMISAGPGSSAVSIYKNNVPKPSILSVSPNTTGNGGVVTISGNNFLTTSQVSFGGTPATSYTIESAGTIRAVVDSGSSGEVTVTTRYGVARFTGFNFSKQPTVVSFTPTKGGAGTVVTINGTNLNAVTSVNFGSVPAASFTIVSPATIRATVGPISDGNYDISLTNASGTASLGSFYTGVTIDSFYPTSGPVGTLVTIKGTHFSSASSDNVVYFGSVRGQVLSASATTLSVRVPPGTNDLPITITVNQFTAYSLSPFVVTFKGAGNAFTSTSFGDRLDSTVGQFPTYVSIADLDGDGKADVISSNFASGSISVSKNTSNNGVTSFLYKTDYPTTRSNVWSTSTGDLDGDGKTDIVAVTNDNSGSLNRYFTVFRNVSTTGSIALVGTEYAMGPVNSIPRYSVIADFDQDGKPDIAFMSFSGIVVFRNTSTPGNISFAQKQDVYVYISSESQIAIADVDGDGKPDMVTMGLSDQVSVTRNTSIPGKISFATPLYITAGSTPRGVAMGDFDNDGKPDMAVVNSGGNSLAIFKNKSTAGVIAFDNIVTYPLGVNPDNLALGDLDGDGRLDIAFLTTRDQFVYVIKNTSTTSISFNDKIAYDDPNGPNHIFIGDMNNDGKMDLVVNNASNANSFSVLVNKCPDDGFAVAPITALGPTEFCEGGNVILKTSSVSPASYQWYKNGTAIPSATDSAFTVTAAGIYTVTILAGSSIATSAPLAVSVKTNPLPPVVTLTGPGNICVGLASVLHSSTQVGVQWYKDNALIDGAIDSIYRANVAGNYKVMAESNGCFSVFSNTISIAVNSLPVASITTTANTFCAGDSAILTANSVNGYSYQWNTNEEQVPGAIAPVFATKSGGNFFVSETDGNGCSAKSATIAITKNPSPAKPVITLENGSLKSSAANGNQWYKDGALITGATSQFYTPTASGNYSVQVTQNNCSSKISNSYSFIVTGIVSIDNTHFIKLSPNPVHHEMVLEFKLNGIYQLNLEVLDLNGRMIRRWKDQKTGTRIFLPDCPAGAYLAKAFSTNSAICVTLKLIKQ